MAGASPAMTERVECGVPMIIRPNWFIIFVDQKFTTSLQRAFTNTFDASAQNTAFPCVYRARNAD
jgi:hypothetical protein